MRTFVPDARTPVLEIEGEGAHVSVNGPQGIVWLGREEWVYLTCHSNHTSDPQIVLARNSQGSTHRLDAHVCPTLSLRSNAVGRIRSLKDFLAPQHPQGGGEWRVVEEALEPPAGVQPKSAFGHMREVALSSDAKSYYRKAALTHLLTDCGEDGWQVVEQVLRDRTDWEVTALAFRLTLERQPERADTLREWFASSLPEDRNERVDLFRQWTGEATTKEALQTVMGLVGERDKSALCSAFEQQARGQTERVFAQTRSFSGLRNAVRSFSS